MAMINRYCSHCGAANPAESPVCFACQSPLATVEESEQATLLNGRYRLLNQVGSGGFGGVYRAVDTAEVARIVAVKQITLRGLSAQEAIEATDGFNRETRLLSALHHPNLPQIRDTFTDPEHWYLVMDFIEGETLEEYLKHASGRVLPLTEVLRIGLQLCTVLSYLHTREPAIIFRDLKPSNVMITASGHIYLIDFGIARHFTPGKPKDTAPFGSPGYAAPEQYGRAQTTPQADIYSLGALLHQMLTGLDPAESPFRFAPLPISDSPELAELDPLIQRMVATETSERPGSISEVQTILQRLADQERRARLQQIGLLEASRLQPAPVPTPRPRARITRRGVLGISMGAVALVAVGAPAVLCISFASHPHFAGSVAVPPPSPGIPESQYIYRGHSGPITALSWSPDGTMIASASADKTVQIWRTSDGRLLYTYYGYTSPVTSLAWSTNPVNEIVSAGQDDGSAQVWNALRDETYLNWQGNGRILALAWQANSSWIASGGVDPEIYIWDGINGKRYISYTGHTDSVRAICWLPGLQISQPATATPDIATPGTATPDAGASNSTASTDSLIASGGADKTVQIWDAVTGTHLMTYSGHTAGVNGLAAISYSYNRAIEAIASASDDQTVHIWDPPHTSAYNERPPIIYRGHRARVNAVANLPSVPYHGPRVASASDDQTVQVWGAFDGEPLFKYTEHQAPVNTLAPSPIAEDKRVASGDANGLVHVWTITRDGYQ